MSSSFPTPPADVHRHESAPCSRTASAGEAKEGFNAGETMLSPHPLHGFLQHLTGGKPSKTF